MSFDGGLNSLSKETAVTSGGVAACSSVLSLLFVNDARLANCSLKLFDDRLRLDR
jgi:hypothetical protein